MKILVIGNGFDLAHGLPTRYDDFMNFLEYCHSIVDNDPKINEYAKNVHNDIKDMVRGEIEDAEKQKHHKSIYKLTAGNTLVEYINQSRTNDIRYNRWVDFEDEILHICNELKSAFDSAPDTDSFYRRDDEQIIDICKLYPTDVIMDIHRLPNRHLYSKRKWDLVKKSLTKEINALCMALEIYLSCYVNKIDISAITNIEFNFDKIVSFNYTNTYERLYDTHADIMYLHGKAVRKDGLDSNIILGFQESSLCENPVDANDYLEFTKTFQRDLMDITNEFETLVDELMVKDIESMIIFYGHSLGFADSDVISQLVTKKNINTVVLFRTKAERTRLTKNLIKCIQEYYAKNKRLITFYEID